MTREEKEQLKKDILLIIKEECDGTNTENIEDWNIASPFQAPKYLKERLFNLVDEIK